MLGPLEKQLIVDDFKRVLDKYGIKSCCCVLMKDSEVFQFTGTGSNQNETVFMQSVSQGMNQMIMAAAGISKSGVKKIIGS